MEKKKSKHWFKAIASFLLVLFTMPLGHALMILMEHHLSAASLHYAGFAMGFVGLVIVIAGVFVHGDTKQTLYGLSGGLLFWTGWVEFLFMYYAHRFGVEPEIINGEIVTKPEYLIMPSSFGFWTMFMVLYLFNVKTGCNFINWCQGVLFGRSKNEIVIRPMTRHTAIVTFMELNLMMWTCYLLLMFCYDPNFLGDHHPVTLLVGTGCLVGAFFMFKRQLKLSSWGANIRMGIATVIVFWTPVEIMGRINLFNEIWVAPMAHKTEMITILCAFILVIICVLFTSFTRRKMG